MSVIKQILLAIVLVVVVIWLLGLRACNDVPSEIGDSVAARAMPTINQPPHPYLNESQRSSMHGGSYNRDLNSYPGPLGNNTRTAHRKFSNIVGVAPNIAFDNEGRLVTVSIKLTGIELHLLDPQTLETLAMLDLPPKASNSDNSGGGYFHLDRLGRPLLAPSDNTIKIYEVVDWDSGEAIWHRLIGAGTGGMIDTLSSVTAPVVLGPSGAAYVGIRTGVVTVEDDRN